MPVYKNPQRKKIDSHLIDGSKPLDNLEHEYFTWHYLETFNAKRAYLAISPRCKEETAETHGPEILRRPEVKARARWLLADRARKRFEESTAEDIRRMFEAAARLDISDYVRWDENGRLTHICPAEIMNMAPVKGFKFNKGELREIRFVDKEKCMESLARFEKMFGDRSNDDVFREQADESDKAYLMRLEKIKKAAEEAAKKEKKKKK